jgi:nucleoside-diphosphate-sugar epimerase
MKIAVIGANGFVGRNLVTFLGKQHTVVPVTRSTLDLLDPIAVTEYLKEQRFDIVINAAASMTDNQALADARNNLGLFMNFYENSDLFLKFINLASGAEYDRELDIDQAPEGLIFSRMPKDSYGWGQNIKSRLCQDRHNFYTIRIFNCFGKGEAATRIFPRYLNRGNDRFEISNDRYFDYFTIEDLCTVVAHCIDNNWLVRDVNAVYPNKFKISEVLAQFCDLNDIEPNFTVVSTSKNNYTGSGDNLQSLGIKLSGLDAGLVRYLDKE